MKKEVAIAKLAKCVKNALPRAGRFILLLLKIMIPISFAMRLLQFFGVIDIFADFVQPLFTLIGLPGDASLVFMTSVFLPLYPAIAVMTSIALSVRQATILAVMCLITHSLPIECTITTKTGSKWWQMVLLRISASFLMAFVLNMVMPADETMFALSTPLTDQTTFGQVMKLFALSSLKLAGLIVIIVVTLIFLQTLLEEFDMLNTISIPFKPLMIVMGLPTASALQWLVGNVFGLSYGGAMLIDQVERGYITKNDANLMNWHLSISHSLLEDTILFAMMGIGVEWLIFPRLFLAIIVVWSYRLFVSLQIKINQIEK